VPTPPKKKNNKQKKDKEDLRGKKKSIEVPAKGRERKKHQTNLTVAILGRGAKSDRLKPGIGLGGAAYGRGGRRLAD